MNQSSKTVDDEAVFATIQHLLALKQDRGHVLGYHSFTVAQAVDQLRSLLKERSAHEKSALRLDGTTHSENCYTWGPKHYECAVARAEARQAAIDRLMWEFCPDEMTAEQKAEWAANQKPARITFPPEMPMAESHGDPRITGLPEETKALPRGKPCTCNDASDCGVEQGNRLGELWYCRKTAESGPVFCCCAEAGGGLVCTLPTNHSGQHEAWGAYKNLLTTWPVAAENGSAL